MGKTNSTGGKGPGYEYWGRRSNGAGKWHNQPGRDDKTLTHRKERRAGKNETKETR
jgi:hypothetical protein